MLEIKADIKCDTRYVHVIPLYEGQSSSVSGQPGLTTGGGSVEHCHQDKSARHLTLITR